MLAHSWLGIQECSCYPRFSLYPSWLSSSLRRVANALPPSWPGYVVPLIAGNGPNTSIIEQQKTKKLQTLPNLSSNPLVQGAEAVGGGFLGAALFNLIKGRK